MDILPFLQFSLETPPISPPQEDSPPVSPQPLVNRSQVQQIKLIPISSQNSLPKNFSLSNGSAAKRICIQPKMDASPKKSDGIIIFNLVLGLLMMKNTYF